MCIVLVQSIGHFSYGFGADGHSPPVSPILPESWGSNVDMYSDVNEPRWINRSMP